jgi:hypothetical protein
LDWLREYYILMAYFAELDENNIVINLIAVHNNELLLDGVENEQKGIDFCNTIKQGRWVQCSFNNRIRKEYPSIGFSYDEIRDEFVRFQPYPSWTLNENNDWVPPKANENPIEGVIYNWDESKLEWIIVGEY